MNIHSQYREVALQMLELPDTSYFEFNENFLADLEDRLIDTPFRGTAVCAPKDIHIDRYKQFPVILLRQTTMLRDWEVRFELNSTLVAVELNTGDYLSTTSVLHAQATAHDPDEKVHERHETSGGYG